VRTYVSHIRLHLIPHLGHVRLEELNVQHVRTMITAIRYGGDISDAGGRRRPGAATCERIRATLRKALNDAVADRLITFNPAAHARPPRTPRAKPQLWTEGRVRRWNDTGERPGPVMVWTPEQTGAFLDHAARRAPDLYPMLHLMAYTGLRRGEAVGLLDADVDLADQRLDVTHQGITLGWRPHSKPRRARRARGPSRSIPRRLLSSRPTGGSGSPASGQRTGGLAVNCSSFSRMALRGIPGSCPAGSSGSSPMPDYRRFGCTICDTAPPRSPMPPALI
jgi:integrase